VQAFCDDCGYEALDTLDGRKISQYHVYALQWGCLPLSPQSTTANHYLETILD